MRIPLAGPITFCMVALATFAFAQPPQGGPPGRGPRGDSPQGGGPPFGPPPLLTALDKDRDGTLSAEEIAAASEALKSLDKNNDGQLTPDELRPEFPPRGPQGQGAPPRDRGDAGEGPRPRRRGADGPPGDRPRGPRDQGPGERGPRDRGPRGDGPPPGDFGPPPGGLGAGPPRHLQQSLGLSEEQMQQLEALHKESREKFERILTAEQREKLQQLGPPGRPEPPRD